MTAAAIPAASVELAIASDSLRELPEGALYRQSAGRAHIEVRRVRDTIMVSGGCDSLAREVERWEEAWHTARDALAERDRGEEREERTKTTTPWLPTAVLTMLGAAAGAVTTTILTNKKRQ